jgi:hypothetical protein
LAPRLVKDDEKVSEVDRERYQKEVVSLEKKLADALSRGPDVGDQAVWEVYAGTEKLIAVLKFRIDYETPGVFTKLPDAKEGVKLLEGARGLLSKSAQEISKKKLVKAVETLREARNNLRSYLTDKKKSATKAARGARVLPATS